MAYALHLGLDFGTSGVRACVLAPDDGIEAFERIDFGEWRDDECTRVWRDALAAVLARLPAGCRQRLRAIAVAGTSATVLACDADLKPLAPAIAYHDLRAQAEAARIAAIAPPDHPAAGASGGLAKVLHLEAALGAGRAACYLNQADWLTGLLSGQAGHSDFHNALKMGYDPALKRWPDWLQGLPAAQALPVVAAPGSPVAALARHYVRALGIASDCLVRAGTTDSIAAFLAAGLDQPGEAVTSLGSTLVLKLLSESPVASARHGVYSHWFGTLWLAGGASNAGAAILRREFAPDELVALSAAIDTETDSGLDYYPLLRPGERFPVNDPELVPRLSPRPDARVQYLHAILEGLADIEARGYRLLAGLGANRPTHIHSAGGGALNTTWQRLRERRIGVPVKRARQQEAAYGAARLARAGTAIFPGTHA